MDLKFPTPSFRVGTIRDSIYSIVSTIEYLEQDGKIRYKELGSSPDGKVTNEFHIFPTNGMAPFAIYDYKFGFDPNDEDNYEEEYEFSIGGASKDAEESARKLGFEVVSESMEEAYHVGDDKEVVTKENKVDSQEKFARVLSQALFTLNDQPKDAIEAYKKSLANDVRLNGIEQYAGYTEEDFHEDFQNYLTDKMDMNETYIRQMKYKAGIIK